MSLVRRKEEVLNFLDVIFCIDSTGSMETFILEVRRNVINMMREIKKSGLSVNFGCVFYGDHERVSQEVVRFYELTGDEKTIEANFQGTTIFGGGDHPEAVADGLHVSLNMNWRRGSRRVVILIGDAPPHAYARDSKDDYPNGCPCGLDPLQEAIKCKDENITIYSIGVWNDRDMKEAFGKFASVTGGSFFALNEVSKLISTIISMLRRELQKIERDKLVYRSMKEGKPLPLPSGEVNEAMESLRKRGVL
ncbi:MAG: vWA domain-containing protein [Nitrosotalea sp.]